MTTTLPVRDRNKELRRVRAGDLLPNPKNWRRHPKAQADALRAVLADVGFVGAALARETPAGLMLLDGHLRAELDANAVISVIVVNDDVDVAVRRWEKYTGRQAICDNGPVP